MEARAQQLTRFIHFIKRMTVTPRNRIKSVLGVVAQVINRQNAGLRTLNAITAVKLVI